MIVAVLDTNVLASGFVRSNPNAPPVQLIDAWRGRTFTLVTSEPILAELAHTLARPYFRQRLSPSQVERILTLLREQSTVTPITVHVAGIATHPEDDLVLATAVSARADHIVTGDGPLQKLSAFRGVTILSPRDFCELLTGRDRDRT